MDLTPVIHDEGKDWQFMGVLSKNREEWVFIHLANQKNSVITVGFYDTLGPSAIDFIINQTKLTTMSCSGNYIDNLIKVKGLGKVPSLLNIVSFDKVTEE